MLFIWIVGRDVVMCDSVCQYYDVVVFGIQCQRDWCCVGFCWVRYL